jgi:hypothetical protein
MVTTPEGPDTLLFRLEDAIRDLGQRDSVVNPIAMATLLRDAASALASPPQKPDVRGIIKALGFDPTNHHNALKCPYCTQGGYPSAALASPPEHDERTKTLRASEQPALSEGQDLRAGNETAPCVLRVRTESACTEHVRLKADRHGVELTIQDSEDGDTRTYLSWTAWAAIQAFGRDGRR